MLNIIPYGRTAIEERLGEFAGDAAMLLSAIEPDVALPPAGKRPFLELSYSEFAGGEIEKVLGFAGISAANAPVGLPAQIPVQRFGRPGQERLFFSLFALEQHLRTTVPEVIEEYERAESFLAFLEAREVSAMEYLAGGLMECSRWSCTHRAALIIRW